VWLLCSPEPLTLSSLGFKPLFGSPNSPLSYTSDSVLPADMPRIVAPAPSTRTDGPICPTWFLVRSSSTRFSRTMTVDLAGTVMLEDVSPNTSSVVPLESFLCSEFRPSSKLGTREELASPSVGFIPAVESLMTSWFGPTGWSVLCSCSGRVSMHGFLTLCPSSLQSASWYDLFPINKRSFRKSITTFIALRASSPNSPWYRVSACHTPKTHDKIFVAPAEIPGILVRELSALGPWCPSQCTVVLYSIHVLFPVGLNWR
jgi:hypothetical protein